MGDGDIRLTTPRTASNIKYRGLRHRAAHGGHPAMMELEFVDDFGATFTATVSNGACTGFNAATGQQVNVVVANGMTNVMQRLFQNRGLTNAIDQLRVDGIVVAPGTVD